MSTGAVTTGTPPIITNGYLGSAIGVTFPHGLEPRPPGPAQGHRPLPPAAVALSPAVDETWQLGAWFTARSRIIPAMCSKSCSAARRSNRRGPAVCAPVECDHLAAGAEFGAGGFGDGPDEAVCGVAQADGHVGWPEGRSAQWA